MYDCAFGPCDNSVYRHADAIGCYLCDIIAHLEIPVCGKPIDGTTCCYEEGHLCPCVASARAGKKERAELKESKILPDLSGPRAAAESLSQVRRSRVMDAQYPRR